MGAPDPALAMAAGESTVRVWYDGSERQRVALLGTTSETVLIRNGQVAWVWSSAEATADRYLLDPPSTTAPDGATPDASLADLLGDLPNELPDGVDLPRTPEQVAEMVVAALDPTTEVTTSGLSDVAGRDVYELVLTPRDPATLVARVTVSMDAETAVPLRVRIDSTTITDPAFEVAFTTVDFSRPAADLFGFTPPPGATVTEHPAVAAPGPEWSEQWSEQWSTQERAARAAAADKPTVVGEGWSTILIGELPADALADLAEVGLRAEGRSGDDAEDGRWHGAADGQDAAGTALALLEALPRTSGTWGSGRVLAGTLVSVMITDDGRVAVGAVRPEALGAALAAQ